MSSKLILRLLAAIALAGIAACDDGPQVCTSGEAGCICSGPSECNPGLACTSGQCEPEGTSFVLNVNEMGGTLDQSSDGFTVDVPPGAVITDTELTFTAGGRASLPTAGGVRRSPRAILV